MCEEKHIFQVKLILLNIKITPQQRENDENQSVNSNLHFKTTNEHT